MNDDELRTIIRAAIQRHIGSGASTPEPVGMPPAPPTAGPRSMSFGQYRIERADGDTMCIIEPAVRCNHCGFCKCHGH